MPLGKIVTSVATPEAINVILADHIIMYALINIDSTQCPYTLEVDCCHPDDLVLGCP